MDAEVISKFIISQVKEKTRKELINLLDKTDPRKIKDLEEPMEKLKTENKIIKI
jgi:hypothetical protein